MGARGKARAREDGPKHEEETCSSAGRRREPENGTCCVFWKDGREGPSLGQCCPAISAGASGNMPPCIFGLRTKVVLASTRWPKTQLPRYSSDWKGAKAHCLPWMRMTDAKEERIHLGSFLRMTTTTSDRVHCVCVLFRKVVSTMRSSQQTFRSSRPNSYLMSCDAVGWAGGYAPYRVAVAVCCDLHCCGLHQNPASPVGLR